jgi:hypothetical protein
MPILAKWAQPTMAMTAIELGALAMVLRAVMNPPGVALEGKTWLV